MQLQDLAEVVVDSDGGYKYIVIEVSNEAGNMRRIVRGNAHMEYHRDIYEEVCRQFPAAWRARCIGGGRITVNQRKRTAAIWDSSGSYGLEPDRAETVRMLQRAFPGFEVTQR